MIRDWLPRDWTDFAVWAAIILFGLPAGMVLFFTVVLPLMEAWVL